MKPKMRRTIKQQLISSSIFLSIIMITVIGLFGIRNVREVGRSRLTEQEELMNQNFDRIVYLQVENALSICDYYYKKSQNGELTLSEAKKQAADVIRELRYEKTNYFWVDTSEGVNVVLLGKETEGTNRFNAKDEKGNEYIKDIINSAKQPDGGYTNYFFPKAGETAAKEKRGYAKYYAPFDWVVGTGNYLEDIHSITEQLSDNINLSTYNVQSAIFFLGIGLMVLSIIIAYLTASRITKPMKRLLSITDSVAKGDFNFNKYKTTDDETGLLANSFFEVADVIKSLVNDLAYMSKEHNVNGNIDLFIDVDRYYGSYKEAASLVNEMVSGYIETNKTAMSTLGEIVAGDFNAPMEKLPGKKVFINDVIEGVRSAIKAISESVKNLADSAIKGNLTNRIDTSNYSGDWIEIMEGLNNLLEAVSTPITEASEALLQMSKGDLSISVKGDYEGSFAIVKDSLNTTVAEISSYIKEINDILSKMAGGDLSQSIQREYLGDFTTIKDSINTINDSLSDTMATILASSEQVLEGSKLTASSASELAQGANEQDISLRELTDSVNDISTKTRNNAQNALNANALSEKSIANARKGNEAMQNMLESMEGIKDSSGNISKIIKVIDDIAFQTNLLALNAAVEAARAGAHGKGFSVVAEEVRNLAGRSLTAAKETSELIENSITRVNNGMKIAEETAAELNIIVENANEVSGLIDQITGASEEQANSISSVSDGIKKISDVVKNNLAATEQSAAASEELNSQAQILMDMINVFKVR